MKEKENIRQWMRQRRDGLSVPYRYQMSKQVSQQVISLPAYQQAETILFYLATQSEVSLYSAIVHAWSHEKRVLFPRVHGKWMVAHQVRQPRELRIGAYGILEPLVSCPVIHPKEIELAFVPGVAFDKEGYRLGYGGGYYDRFFASMDTGERIGVAYREQFVETIYPEDHDQPMDQVLIPEGLG